MSCIGFDVYFKKKKLVCSNVLIFPHTFSALFQVMFDFCSSMSWIKALSRTLQRRRRLERRKKAKISSVAFRHFSHFAYEIHIFFNFRAFKRILCCHRNWGSPISSFEQKRNQNDTTSNKRNFRRYFSLDFLKNCWKSQVRNKYTIHKKEQKWIVLLGALTK